MTKITLRFALLLLLVAAGGAAAQGDPPAPKKSTTPDPEAQDIRLTLSDARELKLDAEGEDLLVDVRMANPLADGYYTCVHVLIDCDDNPRTGMQDFRGGHELWVRAAVGSRFVPNTGEAKGAERPLDLRRASYSNIGKSLSVNGPRGSVWLHQGVLQPPDVDGDTLRFKFPKRLALEFKSEYHSRVAVRVRVETSNADQPLMIEKTCDDEGLAIVVDGDDSEWSGSPFQKDRGGELHPSVSFCDLLQFKLDHDANHLFASITLDKPGLAENYGGEGDVIRQDALTLQIEPMSGSYGPPRRFVIPFGRTSGNDFDAKWILKETALELSMPRASGDSRFRALAWRTARRIDVIPNEGPVKLDFK